MGKERKMDPMNGHVETPWFYFLTFLLMAVLCLGLFILSIYAVQKGNAAQMNERITF